MDSSTNFGTSSTGNTRSLTLDDLKRVMDELGDMYDRMPPDWIVVAPDGRMWKGDNPLKVAAIALDAVNRTPYRNGALGMFFGQDEFGTMHVDMHEGWLRS